MHGMFQAGLANTAYSDMRQVGIAAVVDVYTAYDGEMPTTQVM